MNVEQYLQEFDVPPPGQIKVEVEIKNDTDYGAQANRAELKVYDNVPRHADTVTVTGIAVLSCCAPGFVVIGAIIFLIGWFGGRDKSAG